MKKALPNTKVTVKLRKSNYKDEWYLIIESYPVYKRGSKRASRVVESINRTISTPIWDKSSIARILPDGTFNYKPKRDLNGIIQCRSTIDQEACIYADNVRKLRQREYDSAILYTDKENEIAAQNERSEQDFIKYFNSIISKRHPNSSNSIIVNWRRVGELLKIYSQGQSHLRTYPLSCLKILRCSFSVLQWVALRKELFHKTRRPPISLYSRLD